MPAVTIHTTQNVRIDYETARLGVRIGAFCIDAVVFVIGYLLLVFLLESAGVVLNPAIVVQFGPVFGVLAYFFLSEMFSRGQTLGKRLLRLRVIRLDGEDPTPADFLIRSIFLLPDVLFTGGMLAVLLVATGGQNQRLGDLVARTVVIHTDDRGGVSLGDILTIRNRTQHVARYPAVERLTDADMLTVKQCLLRHQRYRNRAHREALQLLARRLAEVLDVPDTESGADPEKFLETLLLDYIVLTR
ncbi:RDD family protein [Lewinella sp. IMCC34183]|uniref:RDD family protein n=1 Tax=Lewinella sp. IMCC34183 TaxID=2248762 RepID=UPI0013003868|nr:RDD family protein [Lewinella sp. IMCC34183]